MSPRRRYRLGKRAERAADTRRRIVEATLRLHDELGITRTSLRAVAERAAVAPSTVLQHFPRMEELIQACGELSGEMAPMPSEAVLIGASSPSERIQRMATAMFEWWELLGPGLDHLRTDRRHLPQVDAWLDDIGRRHRLLAVAALGDSAADRADLLVALTMPDAWTALRRGGTTPRTAGAQVAQLFGPLQSTSQETIH